VIIATGTLAFGGFWGIFLSSRAWHFLVSEIIQVYSSGLVELKCCQRHIPLWICKLVSILNKNSSAQKLGVLLGLLMTNISNLVIFMPPNPNTGYSEFEVRERTKTKLRTLQR
jgi:hypothetical protein